MELLKNTYNITLYENGNFCWKVTKMKKDRNAIKRDLAWCIAAVGAVAIAVICLSS